MNDPSAHAQTYPCLQVLQSGLQVPLRRDHAITIGRSQKADLSFPDDKMMSREQARIAYGRAGYVLEPLSQHVPTFLNDRPIDEPQPLAQGDVIKMSDKQLVVFLKAPADIGSGQSGDGPLIKGEVDDDATMVGRSAGGPAAQATGDIPLDGSQIIGRGAKAAQIVLDHPQVSRRHAEVTTKDGAAMIRDLASANGTFVNGAVVTGTARLAVGDVVDIGPFSLEFTGHSFTSTSRVGNIRIIADQLTRVVPTGTAGTPAKILDDVTLVIEPNEFVCLLGPSGSGKSTLMNALSARQPASEGRVLINDVNLYRNFEMLKEDIALVPQHDLLHEDLSLREALTYTARLRLPADRSSEMVAADIERTVASVELGHRIDSRIATYSGGQKKRASLANETVSGPSLLFLDEVTSGLDEATDWEMMRLFRQMAERGRTVVCVTHTLVNVEEFCHKVVVMTNPGVLAFYGSPAEALDYFGVKKLGDIYRKLADRAGADWKAAYETSAYCQRYIDQPLSDAADRAETQARRASAPPTTVLGEIATSVRQFGILTARTARLLLGDRKTLGIAATQSVIIALLLALIFGSDVPSPSPKEASILFLLGICSLWFGVNNASKEIVKERSIYLQERAINLSVFAYVLAKMLVFSVLALVQVAILVAIFYGLSVVPGATGSQIGFMALAALAGNALGLAISAATSTRDQANTLVPLALIPQIALAGVIVPDMPDLAERVAQVLISGYWAFEGMSGVLAEEAQDVTAAMTVLIVHTVVYLAVAYVTLLVRGDKN